MSTSYTAYYTAYTEPTPVVYGPWDDEPFPKKVGNLITVTENEGGSVALVERPDGSRLLIPGTWVKHVREYIEEDL